MPDHDPARFERSVAAGISIPGQFRLLKLVAVVELPDGHPLPLTAAMLFLLVTSSVIRKADV